MKTINISDDLYEAVISEFVFEYDKLGEQEFFECMIGTAAYVLTHEMASDVLHVELMRDLAKADGES